MLVTLEDSVESGVTVDRLGCTIVHRVPAVTKYLPKYWVALKKPGNRAICLRTSKDDFRTCEIKLRKLTVFTKCNAHQMTPFHSWRNYWSSPLGEEANFHQKVEENIKFQCSNYLQISSKDTLTERQTILHCKSHVSAHWNDWETVPPRHFTHCLRRFSADVTRRKSRAFESFKPEVRSNKKTCTERCRFSLNNFSSFKRWKKIQKWIHSFVAKRKRTNTVGSDFKKNTVCL